MRPHAFPGPACDKALTDLWTSRADRYVRDMKLLLKGLLGPGLLKQEPPFAKKGHRAHAMNNTPSALAVAADPPVATPYRTARRGAVSRSAPAF
mgnify:CR=1 FL=1